MPTLLIVRHGQSVWNLENRFTGEVDVDLSPLGEHEARQAGRLLKPYTIDRAYTSMLKRAMHTLTLIEEETGTQPPVERSAALNERNYGALQGLNKDDVTRQYGIDQVNQWRRSFTAVPPQGESLQQTQSRVLAYYTATIEPHLKTGETVLIVAHGNSLRALMMHLEGLTPTQIETIDLATGVPRCYTFDTALHVLDATYLTEHQPAAS